LKPIDMETRDLDASTRRMNVGDMLILVAALCVTLWSLQGRIATLPARASVWLHDYHRFRSELSIRPMSHEEFRFWVNLLGSHVSEELWAGYTSTLVPLTLAQLVMRLRRPRPAWPNLARQPGFVACCAAVIGCSLDGRWIMGVHFPFMTSTAVLLAWGILLGLRRWQPEPSGIDRLGRAVGAGWIAAEFWSLLEDAFLR
jgi:hypothetical protein